MEVLQFLDLAGLKEFKEQFKTYVDDADATSIKGVGLSEDGKSMLFYKEEPIEGAEPKYSVELPVPDTSNLMSLVTTAVENNIAIFDADGQVIDSGKTIDEIVEGITAELGTAAYKNVEDFDEAGAAAAVLGTEDDEAGTATVYGALVSAKAAQDTVDELKDYVGTIPEDAESTTIVDYINEIVSDSSYDDSELTERVSELESAVETLNGDKDVEGSVDAKVEAAKEELTEAIAEAIGNSEHLKKEIVEELPDVNDADDNTIYLVLKENSSENDVYDEWMVINGQWEHLGSTATNLTGYATEEYVDSAVETALTEAKEYTDTELENIQAIPTSDIIALFED